MFICSAWLLLGVSKPPTPPGRALSNPQLPLSAHGDLSSISPVGITYARCGSPGNESKTKKKKNTSKKNTWAGLKSSGSKSTQESGPDCGSLGESMFALDVLWIWIFPPLSFSFFFNISSVIFFLHFPDWADCQVLFFFVQNATLFASLDNLTQKNFHFLS